PDVTAADGRGVRVQHDRPRVEAVARLRVERAVDAVAVQDVGLQAVDEDVPDVAGPIDGRVERDLGDGLLLPLLEEHQVDAVGVAGEDGEVHAAGAGRGPEGPAVP